MKRARRAPDAQSDSARGYLQLAERPLHVLAFLLPLIVVYEIGALAYLTWPDRGVAETIAARRMLAGFFETFGVFGLHLPAFLLLTVLLIWHILLRDPWRLRPHVLLGMFMESCLWTVPLLILGMLIAPAPALQLDPAGAPASIDDLSWQARLTVAIGAGLYEELLFRMIAIAAIHFILADLLRLSQFVSQAGAVAVSAVAFALYHDLTAANGGTDLGLAVFYSAAGVFFGSLYILRGFGIVVAVHALYDVTALVLVGGA